MSPTFGRGGAEEYLLAIARAATSRFARVDAALPDVPGTRSVAADLRAGGLRVHALPLLPPAPDRVRAIPYLLRDLAASLVLLARVRPGVVLLTLPAHNLGLGTVLAARLARVPLVTTFHLVVDVHLRPGRRRLHRAGLRGRGRWVAVSEHVRRELAERLAVDPSRIDRIENGTRLPAPPGEHERARARADVRGELGLPADAALVLTVGRLTPQKGHRHLVPALARLRGTHPRTWLVWAGDGPEAAPLAADARAAEVEDRILFLGHRADVPRLLAAADVLALPSLFEGHPFALIEALAAGLPIVAADRPPMSDMVEDGRTGLTVPVEEPERLAERLAWALEHRDAMRAMARAGQEIAMARYDERRMLDETLDLLVQAAGCRR